MDDGDAPRPKRQCAQRRSRALPSASHYVGYVEEDETPEMIMKKFEELERVMNARAGSGSMDQGGDGGISRPDPQALPPCADGSETVVVVGSAASAAAGAAAGAADGAAATTGLDESMLLEVFKRTR